MREVLEGSPIGEVAQRYGTSRQSLDVWRKRFLAEGLPSLTDRSRRPRSSPRIPAELEALICQLRREHPRWGARRIVYELGKHGRCVFCGLRPSAFFVIRMLSRDQEGRLAGRLRPV